MSQLNISDNAQNTLVIVNLESMSVKHNVPVGKKPYPVDMVRSNIVFVSTRDEYFIQPVNVQNGVAEEAIPLEHKPRSTTSHKTKALALVSGADKALTTVIDTGTMNVLFTVGSGRTDTRRDYGGGLACGHPFWGNNDEIIHLDRIERRVEIYDYQSKDLLDSINLPTSAHHVEKVGEYYYLICEGNRESLVAPSIMQFKIAKGKIDVLTNQFLPIPQTSLDKTGGHHLAVDESRSKVYVGTADSHLFTLSSNNLSIENCINSGKGCGHVTICSEIGVGVTTNHSDTEMTIFDLSSGSKTGSITISSSATSNKKTQGHTSKWFPDTEKLITSAAQDGKVLEIDPVAQSITREVSLPEAYLIQGCFSSLFA
ncbi:MAG: hypothetical protein GY797_12340 [Deltaproteobacteria bacterium]|nr:hypothetical protein [Deltaproteobacteria bacterium]